MNISAADVRAAIEKHFEVFQQLVGRAKHSLLEREHEKSAAYAQVAAYYAQFHPTGLFASTELETILAQVGKALPVQHTLTAHLARVPPRNVMHVLTEVHSLGGHTRLVWRWIRMDGNRRHSVVFTRQMDAGVPQPLKAAVEAAGGRLHFLDRHRGGLLTRAQALRRLAADADHVVLHTHSYDVVPLIAFAEKGRRPHLTLMNKDDAVFWLGVSLVDQVAQMRDSGRRLSLERRGVLESQCSTLPIPLQVKPGPRRRLEAKIQLGLPEDSVVLLTVATAYKYSALGSDHFVKILLPVVQKYRDAVLLVVGPEERDEWASASKESAGRIMLFGKRRDVETFYEAADIYLDSFPFSSLTSFLEAGSYGTPIVSYCMHPTEADVTCGDDPALSDLIIRACCPDEYRKEISRLIENELLRSRLGEATRESILAYHTEGGWIRFLEGVYLHSWSSSSDVPQEHRKVSRNVTELDIRLAKVFALSGLSREMRNVLRNHVGLFPLRERMRIWREFLGSDWGILPRLLFADWQKTWLRQRLTGTKTS